MIVTAYDLQNFSMPELWKIRENKICGVFVFIHLYVVLKFCMVYFSGSRIDLGLSIIIALFIFLLHLFFFGIFLLFLFFLDLFALSLLFIFLEEGLRA